MNKKSLEPPNRRAPRKILTNIVIRVLRPLARLMLQHGVTLYEFIEIARWVFANVAMDGERFSMRDRDAWSMTKSRGAVLTGMTRRQVDRQVRLPEPATEDARRTYHRSVRVLAVWATEPAYLDECGLPGELPLRGEHGSFETLVRAHCRDISMRSMLDELVSRGCVMRTAGNTLRFLHADLDATSPLAYDVQQLQQAVEDFMRLLERQFNNPQPGALMYIASPALTSGQRVEVQARLRRHMESFVADVQNEFTAVSSSLLAADGEQLVAGVYWTTR